MQYPGARNSKCCPALGLKGEAKLTESREEGPSDQSCVAFSADTSSPYVPIRKLGKETSDLVLLSPSEILPWLSSSSPKGS